MTVADEAAEWAAARGGDSRAFGAIYDRHYDRVFRHVSRITEQHADADEVTASVFFELWRHRARARVVNGSVLPWLLVTAGNLSRNHGRKAARYRDAIRRLPRDHDVLDPTVAVDEQRDAVTRTASLATVLEGLRPADAQLLALTTEGGLSVTEAAAALGITPGAARVRLHRARRRLLDVLAPADLPDPAGGAT